MLCVFLCALLGALPGDLLGVRLRDQCARLCAMIGARLAVRPHALLCDLICALLRVLLCVPLCAQLCVLLRASICALRCALSGVPLSCVLLHSSASLFYSGCSFRAEFPFASPVSALLVLPSACWFGRRVVFSRPRPSTSLFMVGALSAPGCQAAESHRGGPSVS